MEIFAETERLLLRELIPSDHIGLFQMDADAEVHRYLGKQPLQHIDEAKEMIRLIRQQYVDNGIGRWAVIEKDTRAFLGWAGLKLITTETNGHINYHDLGYRLMRRYWGMGFATEAAAAAVDHGFEQLQLDAIYAIADTGNVSSVKVLQKSGLQLKSEFNYGDAAHYWLQLTRKEWLGKRQLKNKQEKNEI